MKKMQKGFTLIELMIVVAIIAILAAIAIPAYQDYLVRSQVTEALSLAGGPETAVAEYYQNHGEVTGIDNNKVGVAQPGSIGGNYVATVTVGSAGIITAAMGTGTGTGFGSKANTKISGQTLVLSPTFSTGSIAWTCRTGTLANKYLPSSCR